MWLGPPFMNRETACLALAGEGGLRTAGAGSGSGGRGRGEETVAAQQVEEGKPGKAAAHLPEELAAAAATRRRVGAKTRRGERHPRPPRLGRSLTCRRPPGWPAGSRSPPVGPTPGAR